MQVTQNGVALKFLDKYFKSHLLMQLIMMYFIYNHCVILQKIYLHHDLKLYLSEKIQ